MQCLVTLCLKDKPGGEWKEFTAYTRDDVVAQLPLFNYCGAKQGSIKSISVKSAIALKLHLV